MKKWIRIVLLIVVAFGIFMPVPGNAARVFTEAVVNSEDVALRSEPRNGAPIYLRLSKDTRLELLGTNYNCEWHKVKYKNRVGYINRMYVDLEGVTDDDSFIGTIVNCAESVNVRSVPDKKGPMLGKANLGEQFSVISGVLQNGYYSIDYYGTPGYVSADYVVLDELAESDQLSSIDISGGVMRPAFSPDQYGYIVRADQDVVTVNATAENGIKVSVDRTKKSINTYQMPEHGIKTVRIRVNGKVKYSIYIVRNVITLCSYNIKRGNKRIVEMGQLIANESPDLMGLQECYKIPQTENTEAVNNLLALRTAHMKEWSFSTTVNYPSGGEYGIGMLSAYEMHDIETINLTSPQSEQRVAMRASVQIDGKNVSVYNTHLSYESKEIRRVQLTEIAEWMNSDRNDYRIVFGDFNITDISEFSPLKRMRCVDNEKTRFFDYDAAEFQSNKIDNILVTENIKVLNVRKDNIMISDHRPLFAYIVLE